MELVAPATRLRQFLQAAGLRTRLYLFKEVFPLVKIGSPEFVVIRTRDGKDRFRVYGPTYYQLARLDSEQRNLRAHRNGLRGLGYRYHVEEGRGRRLREWMEATSD